jgi:hypothetical protein
MMINDEEKYLKKHANHTKKGKKGKSEKEIRSKLN